MNKKISSSLVFSFAIVVALGIASMPITSKLVYAVPVLYHAKLTGQQEVPPVNSSATGVAKFAPLSKSVKFLVNATGITGVTAAHIHLGKEGQNGPVVVKLINSTVHTNNVFQKGIITSKMLEGPLKGKTVSDLLSAMKKGNTYVNIHTIKHPNGEIRGDVVFKKPLKHSSSSSSSSGGKHFSSSSSGGKHSSKISRNLPVSAY
ncbi:MAG TPA: CHRD domain-containing protein [Verrucomicrobiae bacterium]|nr:CHRD domain-containing protein [Verrucomicrobiae bacterium]